MYTWGDGQDGRLGHDNSLTESEPRVVLGLLEYKVADVSAGGAHTAAVTVDGSLFTWGRGRNGRLGNSSHADSAVPFHVRFGKHTVHVRATGHVKGALCVLVPLPPSSDFSRPCCSAVFRSRPFRVGAPSLRR